MLLETSNLSKATTELFHFCVNHDYQELRHTCLSTSSWSNLHDVNL